MGGFFGTIKKTNCVADLYYGVDYNSHLGTKRGGMVTFDKGYFTRSILIFARNLRLTCQLFREIRVSVSSAIPMPNRLFLAVI